MSDLNELATKIKPEKESEVTRKKPIIKNPKERSLVQLSILLASLFVIVSLPVATPAISNHLPLPLAIRDFLIRGLNFGSKWVAIAGIAFAMGWYIVTGVMKRNKRNNNKNPQIIITSAKTTRQYHVPVAILALGFAVVHSYMQILNGIKWQDLGFYAGFLAIALFISLMFSGVKRYRGKYKLHLVSSITLISVLVIHIIYFMFFYKV